MEKIKGWNSKLEELGQSSKRPAKVENEPHIVDLKLAFALILLLEVTRELVEDGTTAAPLSAEARWAADLVNLQASLFIWNSGQERKKEGKQLH